MSSIRRYIEIWKDLQPPSWQGPPECVDSKRFIAAYLKYQCSDKGYIRSKDVFGFAETLLYGLSYEGDFLEKEKNDFQVQLFHHFKRKNWEWVSMKDLYHSLSMLKGNFLGMFRGRRVFTSVDFMKIWSHYDNFDTGALDVDSVWAFAFDLLSSPEQKFDPRILKLVMNKLLDLCGSKTGTITFHQMQELLHAKNLIMRRFPGTSKIAPEDFNEVFSLYDKDDNKYIGGEELRALIKDIEEFYGKTPGVVNINEQMKYMMLKADHNRDGKISRKEIRDLLVF